MDILIKEIIDEISSQTTTEFAKQFIDYINCEQYRQAYLVLDKIMKRTQLSEKTIKNIEIFWWKYAN
jgi:Cdc6-like AAA superfamily ATPase